MSLEEAIQQLINLGEKDPLVIARKIEEHHDAEWTKEELYALREDLISEIARHRLGSLRRSSLAVITRGPEARLAPVWIPYAGWKKLADLTVDDLRELEGFYAKLRDAAAVRVQWCAECIAQMLRTGVSTLGEIEGPIPAVPELEEAV